MPDYLTLKALHVAFVVGSGALFVVRGALLRISPRTLQTRWLRVLPHVVDTLLLAAAIGMLVVASINPFESSWLTAKIIALLFYIGVGTIALKRGRTAGIRLAAWLLALASFAYIVAVAFTKQPWPF